ncbi:MAG TPA: hypothetical protein EYP05_07255, partial [Piscirickettsiaceae bacterium]|nr:hypothetical protein [Piscirickettsiaceae bacterium]
GLFGKSRKNLSANGGATIIAEGCWIKGELGGLKTPLYVEGTLEGQVISEAEIVVGPKGRIVGEVRARHLVVNGVVEGRIVCEQLEILASGTVNGTLMTGKMAIEPGGRFVGRSMELGNLAEVNILAVTFGEEVAELVGPEHAAAVIEKGSP